MRVGGQERRAGQKQASSGSQGSGRLADLKFYSDTTKPEPQVTDLDW